MVLPRYEICVEIHTHIGRTDGMSDFEKENFEQKGNCTETQKIQLGKDVYKNSYRYTD